MKVKKTFQSSVFSRQVIKHLYAIVGGIILCNMLSGCYSTKHYMSRYADVWTEPNAIVFWENGQKITKADENGHASIGVSDYMYRKGYKKVTVAKSGHEPQTVSLKKKFNGRVMYNLFFPPAFLWAHYTKLNPRKPNIVPLTTDAENDAQSYLNMAQTTSSKKKKTKLLMNAIYQDPDNEEGLAIVSAHTLSDLYYKKKDYEESQFWAECGTRIDPKDGTSQENIQRAKIAIVEKAERKRRRAEMWNMAFSALSAGLSTAATISSMGNSSTSYSSIGSSSAKSSRTTQKHCKHCAGTGTCPKCRGNGRILGTIDQEFRPCPECNYGGKSPQEKRGKCNICGGTGLKK